MDMETMQEMADSVRSRIASVAERAQDLRREAWAAWDELNSLMCELGNDEEDDDEEGDR